MKAKDLVLFGWAFFESIAWFIAADYPLFLYALREDAWERLLGVVTAGSALGIISHYVLFSLFPSTTETVLLHTPFVQDWMLSAVEAYLEESMMYALVQPYTLIAVKTWTYTVFMNEHSFPLYFVLVMAGRVTRWGVVVLAAKGLTWMDERVSTTWFYYVWALWTSIFAAIMLLGET